MIKQQFIRGMKILNFHGPNYRVSKYMKQKSTILNRKIDKSNIEF